MARAGFRPSPRWLVRQSMTTRLVKPVASSVFSATEAPSTRSSNADFALDFGQHRTGVGIPFGQTLAAADLVAFLDAGAWRHRSPCAWRGPCPRRRGWRCDTLRAMTTSLPPSTLATFGLRMAILPSAPASRNERVDHLRRATDVERAHGELGARFTDRLRGDDADSFADVDRRTASKVTTIAGRAAALAHVAGQRRADADRLDLGLPR